MTLAPPFPDRYAADPFGVWQQWRKDMGLGPHRGKDYNGLPNGTPIPASGKGRVVWRTNLTDAQAERTELGHRIVVAYDLGDGREIRIGYSHLDQNPALAVGVEVALGDTVGLIGNSGTASTGDHLHLTASWVTGDPSTVEAINPDLFFAGTAPAAGGRNRITNTEGDEDMGVQVRIQERGGLGRTLFISPTIVTHVVHDDVVRVNNYVGVPGGGSTNQVSVDDARRLVEARGFDWAKVNALDPGQGVTLDGRIVNAGAAKW